jgi:membrane-anchored glycerophosphoryl diester phosphodiesterase (GDPDase)
MYQKKIYYPYKIIYLLILLFKDLYFIAYTTFCVYFIMFSPKRAKEQFVLQSPTNHKKQIKKRKGRET